MTPVEAVCDPSYTAAHDSGTRGAASVKWIVLHDEEATTARSAAEWFTNPESGGSAHLCVDDDICYRCLANDQVPWAAVSSFGANLHGFHIEQAGFAAWGQFTWFLHMNTLRRAAYKTALHCRVFGVPARFVSAKDLPTLAGITTHAQITQASKRLDPANAWRYTHTDPGLFWPRRLFMSLVRRYAAGLGVTAL